MKKSYLQKIFNQEVRFSGFTQDWKVKKLGGFLTEFSNKSKVENEYPVLSSTNSGIEYRSGRVSGESNLRYKIIEVNDLVLSPQNLWLGNINFNHLEKGLVSPSYKSFKINQLNINFFESQIHLPRMLEEYKNSSTQGASVVRRNLDLEAFYQIEIKVPLSEEQKIIGFFFKTLDAKISHAEEKLSALTKLKKAYLQRMFI